MYKILVIGSTGKIGNYVLKELLEHKEFEVRLLLRKKFHEQFPEIFSFRGDIADVKSLHKAIEWCDVVVNCSGIVSYKAHDHSVLNQTNVIGTENILEACAKFKKQLLHTSSAVVYGSTNQPLPHTEIFNNSKIYLSGYAKSKLAADQLILRSSVKSLILRPSTLITANGSTFAKLLELYRKGFRAGLQGGASFVSPCDIAKVYGRAILYLIKSEHQTNIFNIGGNNVLIREIFDFLIEQEPRRTIYISSRMLNALSLINDTFLLPVLNKSIITRDNYLTGSLFTYLNSEKAIQELGYTITPFFEAANKTLRNAYHGH